MKAAPTLLRVGFALLLLHAAWVSLGETAQATLCAPYTEGWALPCAWLHGLSYLRVALAALVLARRCARAALWLSAAAGLLTLFSNTFDYHHNRYALFVYAIALGVAFAPRGISTLGVLMTRAQCSFIYLVSAGTKLMDPDWSGGAVLRARFIWYQEAARAHGVPEACMRALQRAPVAQALSLSAIACEFFLALGLWFPRTRRTATIVGIGFHVLIQLTAKVETFSLMTVLVYLAFWLGTPAMAAEKSEGTLNKRADISSR